ncbi:hypothetical protein HY251_02170, partial [bacterium]|nr:hypothetical protein [bacterium]
MRPMRSLLPCVAVACVAALASPEARAQDRPGDRLRERLAEKTPVGGLRTELGRFFDAKEKGDKAAANEAAAKARKSWESLPEGLRTQIESKHPGTTERMKALEQEFDLPAESVTKTGTGPGGKVTGEGTVTKDGNTTTGTGSVTGPNGKTATGEGTATKDGNTVTGSGSVTGPNGKTATGEGTATKDGNTVTGSGSVTGPNGKTATGEGTATKDGNT